MAAPIGFGSASFSGLSTYHGRIDGLPATAATSIALALLSSAGLAEAIPLDREATPSRAYYQRCPNLQYRGKHKLFRHALACRVARREARYVLKNRTHPPGWRCSLDNLAEGYGACARGKRAFEFLPL
jgi:hypothetical protein